ncbi:MAG TPA: hybrid sensor histidine kinase/response regulator [Oculatellaceae cyanobacterium]
MSQSISILLVEDNPADAIYVEEVLSHESHTVTTVQRLGDAKNRVLAEKFDIVLLDLSLPDGQGMETFLSLNEYLTVTPVIILTGLDDEDTSLQAVKLGAQDYILKKEMTEYQLSRAIRYAIERKQSEESHMRLAVLEQREEFMATLTHDLKVPLIGANRILELMAAETWGKVNPEQIQLLLQMRDNNKQLLSMVQNLIEVYRFEREANSVNLERTNLVKTIRSCIADIEPIVKNRNIELKTDFRDVDADVVADGVAIRRVVQNLLDNAVKFTPRGGSITVSTQPAEDFVSMEVADTGPGVPESERDRLFKRFSQGTTGRKYTPGTGLGLYLCKQIVEAHKGEITFASREEKGSTFRVKLPAVQHSELQI